LISKKLAVAVFPMFSYIAFPAAFLLMTMAPFIKPEPVSAATFSVVVAKRM
jgi:hypothetical protein